MEKKIVETLYNAKILTLQVERTQFSKDNIGWGQNFQSTKISFKIRPLPSSFEVR